MLRDCGPLPPAPKGERPLYSSTGYPKFYGDAYVAFSLPN